MEPEQKCNHWTTDTDKDQGARYCKGCLVIMEEVPHFYGSIKIGQLSNNYEVGGSTLDIKMLIEDHMGTIIELTNVIIGPTPDRYWEVNYMVGFTIGKSLMMADLSANRSTKYIPTGRFYTPKLEVVEEA
jgi:hypothetical protein